MKNEKKIAAVANEAARIMRDYLELKHYEAIMKAKEVLRDELRERNHNERGVS